MSSADTIATTTTTRLHVSGLAPDVTDADLRTLFAKVGRVASASIARSRFEALSRGFGYVDVAADAAMTTKFRNAGQTCVCADRLRWPEFVEALLRLAQFGAATGLVVLISAHALSRAVLAVRGQGGCRSLFVHAGVTRRHLVTLLEAGAHHADLVGALNRAFWDDGHYSWTRGDDTGPVWTRAYGEMRDETKTCGAVGSCSTQFTMMSLSVTTFSSRE